MAREIDETFIEEAVARYRRIESLQAQYEEALRGVTVSVRSPDDAVEVVVSAGGDIRDVRLLGPAQGRTGAELSQSIQTAVAAAADAARWAREKLHAETFVDFRPIEEG